MRLVVGAGAGSTGPHAPVVSGVEGDLVFVSRATAHAATVPNADQVRLLSKALEEAWRRPGPIPTRLAALLEHLHAALVRDHGETRRARTIELCAAVLDGERVWTTNVSAHRVWRVREGRVEQLTRDWTVDEERLRQGLPRVEGLGSIVTRVLGRESQAAGEIVIAPHPVAAGDVLLLTSSWFQHALDDAQQHRLIARAGAIGDPETAARFLLAERALARDDAHADFALANTGVLVARVEP